ISSLDYSSYVGRIAVGRITCGSAKAGMTVSLVKRDGRITKSVIKELYLFEGLGKEKVKWEVGSGEICAVLGPENFDIGDTIADGENPVALKPIAVDEPTMSMVFTINNSPFAGKDGTFVTSRNIRERLFKETEKNLALRVEETETPEKFLVYGRGVLHLAILVETMRREGYEFQLGQPQVITKRINGVTMEPVENLTIQVPEAFSGKVIELVTRRRGEIVHIETKRDRVFIEFTIPARGLIGLRNPILTATEGEAVMAHRFKSYEPWRGDMVNRINGSLIAMERGTAITYSIDKLQDRGKFFIEPNDPIYAGQVVGENTRSDDMLINLTKTKKLSNVRASGSDDKAVIIPAIKFSLEEAMEYIQGDEYVEVTPKTIRLRKIILDEIERKRSRKVS
ncbi:MAG: translational GTPase TypA, partial [Bacteroidia bacterium]|nr:translational GTPase TypA [Bacteroidia bacterium]